MIDLDNLVQYFSIPVLTSMEADLMVHLEEHLRDNASVKEIDEALSAIRTALKEKTED